MMALTTHRRLDVIFLWVLIGYFVISTITIPFLNLLWWGEMPLLALIQLPKISFAHWLRRDVVMEAMQMFGWSYGSASPDHIAARPYALAMAYVLLLGVSIAALAVRGKLKRPLIWLVAALAAVMIVDYVATLIFAAGPHLTIY